MISAVIYDEQPAGSKSGPIRWVAGFTSQAALDVTDHPYVVLSPGAAMGITTKTHHVVNGEVVALEGAAPAPITPILSPHPPPQ